MPILSSQSVFIELPDAMTTLRDNAEDGDATVQVVRSTDKQGGFTMIVPGGKRRELAREESDRLFELVGQISIVAPWQGMFGMDGMTSELIIQGTMSRVTFSWWGDAPKEWNAAANIFDYVMEMARRLK